MSDQPDNGVDDLADFLSDDPIEETDELENEQTSDEEGQQEADEDDVDEAEEEADEPEEEEADEPSEKFKLTVKNDKGDDEEKELTLEELAEGYMLTSDYTRKRQAEAETLRTKEQEYYNATVQTHQQSAEVIDQLKQLVIQSVAPELAEITPNLANENPAQYVALQAKQAALEQTLQQLDQTKQQTLEQSSQAEMQARGQGQELDKVYVQSHVPEFAEDGYQKKAIEFANETYGITPNDLAFLTSRPTFKDGGMLDGGKLIHMLNDAMKFHNLETQKPIQMKKVKSAPKIIKPNAPKPKRNRNKEADARLKKYGRLEDLAAFL